MTRIMILVAMLFAWLQAAQAGGFMVGEMATRSTGMGSAFTAVADDPSAAWHNPAGVAYSNGMQVMAGGAAIIVPTGDFTSNTANPLHPRTTSSGSQAFFVPHTYFTYMDQDSRLGASLSINAPFGLETDWPTTGPFANKNTFSRIQMANINPSVVFMLADNFAIAAGVSYTYVNNVDLNNTIQLLNGDGDGWGGNASIFYKGDGVNFGVTYRSRIKIDVDGTATAVSTGALSTAFGGTSSTAKTQFTLPDMVNVGLAWMPNEDWTLSVDVDWVNWKTYDSVDITYDSAAYRTAVLSLQTAVGATATGKTTLPQNWSSTVAFRAGAEWKYNSQMSARIGYVFDPTPIEDVDFSPSVPGNDRHIMSIGYSYNFNAKTTIDLAYAFVYFVNRDQIASPVTAVGAPNTVKNGRYESTAHIVAGSLTHRF